MDEAVGLLTNENIFQGSVVLGARYSVYVSQGFKAQRNYEGKGMLLLLVQVVHIAQHGWLNYYILQTVSNARRVEVDEGYLATPQTAVS